jgi:acyl carrier protein
MHVRDHFRSVSSLATLIASQQNTAAAIGATASTGDQS